MLKYIATTQLALAGLFALPGLTGAQDSTQGLVAQLDATIASLDYLGEIAKRVESRSADALPLLLGATEPRRMNDLQNEARVLTLRGDVSRLQLALDRLLEQAGVDPRMPGVHMRSGGSAGNSAETRAPRTSDNYIPGALAPTIGLDAGLRGNLQSVLPPLQVIEDDSKRKGPDLVSLESADYSADAVRHGKLLFRAGRYPESIQLLIGQRQSHEARYWLAQSYRAMERNPEALDILRMLATTPAAGAFARYAQADIEFMEFERQLRGIGANNTEQGK